MTRKTLGRLLGLAIVSWASLLSSSARAEQEVTLEKIAKAWKERQERVRSVHFAWTERETIRRGYVTDMVGSLPAGEKRLQSMNIPPGSVAPPEDATHDVPSSICVDGDKVRYERQDRQWSGKERAYVVRPRVTTFDGKVGTTFYPAGSSFTHWPQGQLQSNHPDAGSLYLSPLIVAFRPFLSPVRLFDPEIMVSSGRKAVFGGKVCWELEQQSGASVRRLWVDPSRDYLPVHYLVTVNEQPTTKMNIHYRKDLDVGWILHEWEILLLESSGRLSRAARARTTEHRINMDVEPTEFSITFPPGTRVHDMTNPKSTTDYIVKEGEKKRMIKHEELVASYEQLVNTETGEALGKRGGTFRSWQWVLVVAAVIVFAAVLLWRWRRGWKLT